ncbi:MAG: hypothetical protein BWY43_00522 [candidate division WS2 bacterium ADurb.Bin280]|uniref:Uncharacterized protein n=1 Tax=candidate division WS2 bacterium ADurb.Bin280 TaxID=1852829 RepID=A0A1V5SD94_9BACT|nr:MAG: hypothetical protein BWY43_00522 [candidate division WS2 bacterium ADurb.Bin280]
MKNLTLRLYENILLQNTRDELVIELVGELDYLKDKIKKMAEKKLPLSIERGDRSAIRSIIRELAECHLKLNDPRKWQDIESAKREELIALTTEQIIKILIEKYPSLNEDSLYAIGPALIEWNFQATQWRNEE